MHIKWMSDLYQKSAQMNEHVQKMDMSIGEINHLFGVFITLKDKEAARQVKQDLRQAVRHLVKWYFNDCASKQYFVANAYGIGGEYRAFAKDSRKAFIIKMFAEAFNYEVSGRADGKAVMENIKKAQEVGKVRMTGQIVMHVGYRATNAVRVFFARIWNWLLSMFKRKGATNGSTATGQ